VPVGDRTHQRRSPGRVGSHQSINLSKVSALSLFKPTCPVFRGSLCNIKVKIGSILFDSMNHDAQGDTGGMFLPLDKRVGSYTEFHGRRGWGPLLGKHFLVFNELTVKLSLQRQ